MDWLDRNTNNLINPEFWNNFGWNTYEYCLDSVKALPKMAFTKDFTKNEWEVFFFINETYHIEQHDLSCIMDKVKSDWRYMKDALKEQKQITNDILQAEELLQNKNIESAGLVEQPKNAIEAKKRHKIQSQKVIQAIRKAIIEETKFMRNSPYSYYFTMNGKEQPKNFYLKYSTSDLYHTLIKRYNVGNSQAFYIIGRIYALYKIGLKEPIYTEEKFEARKASQSLSNEDFSYEDYNNYLKSTLQSYLIS